MPVEVIKLYPCKSCGGWDIEVRKECTYYWVDFGTLLLEHITNYICESCKYIIIQVVEHKKETYDWETPEKEIRADINEYRPHK